jgi:uncharacterized protein (TIGR02284 family)
VDPVSKTNSKVGLRIFFYTFLLAGLKENGILNCSLLKKNFMERNEKTIDVLNDLIRINNDRVEGYEKAVRETNENDVDLRNIFNRMAQESRNYTRELTEQVRRLGGEPASGTTASGKIYRTWMDIKSGFSRSERKSVLEECEFGEDAAQKAYDKALDPDNSLPPDVRTVVQEEKTNLRTAHDTIKNYRDLERSANK